MEEVISHPWFKGIDKDKLLKKEIVMPDEFKPHLSDNQLDLKYFSSEFTDLPKRESIIGQAVKKFIDDNAHEFAEFGK